MWLRIQAFDPSARCRRLCAKKGMRREIRREIRRHDLLPEAGTGLKAFYEEHKPAGGEEA